VPRTATDGMLPPTEQPRVQEERCWQGYHKGYLTSRERLAEQRALRFASTIVSWATPGQFSSVESRVAAARMYESRKLRRGSACPSAERPVDCSSQFLRPPTPPPFQSFHISRPLLVEIQDQALGKGNDAQKRTVHNQNMRARPPS
jgi:hypothetical protein